MGPMPHTRRGGWYGGPMRAFPGPGGRSAFLVAALALACSDSGGTSGAGATSGSDGGSGDGGGSGTGDATDDGAPTGLLVFDPPGGLFSAPFSLSITSEYAGTIRHTLDGSPPDETSPMWTEGLEIADTTRVRAVLLDSELAMPPRGSHTYLRQDPDLAFESNLPIVVIATHGEHEIDNPDRPRLHHPVYTMAFEPGADGLARLSDAPAFHGRGGMHIRGNSTTDYDKKQYKLEIWDEDDTDRDVALLGMPKESDWVVHAPYSDKTLMRNHLVYTWSRAIGRYAARTRFCEVFIDWDDELTADDYVGVYVWMEKVKVGSDRVAVTKLRPEDEVEPAVTGGYLLLRDWIRDEEEPKWITTSVYEDEIRYVHPTWDEITPAQEGYIGGYLDDMEETLAGAGFADPTQGYAAFIDVDSFIDHHLIVELARNVDGFVLSTYMHKDREGKLHMGPVWDYNGALGNADYFEAWEPQGWHHQNPEFPADNPNGYRWYERLFEDPDFQDRYAARWRELRQGPWATEALLEDIDEAAALLQQGAVERNFQRWPVLGQYVWPNDPGHEERTTYQAEIDYLKDWLRQRLTWIDGQLAG